MAFKSMRDFVTSLEAADQLRRVDLPLDARRGSTELQALMRYLHQENGPALMLENLQGDYQAQAPVLFNPFGSRERSAAMLGQPDWASARRFHGEVLESRHRWVDPVIVDGQGAPCKEVVIRDVDLRRDLPQPFLGKEGASYVTGAIVVTKDPETGARNVGWYRLASFVGASHPLGGSYAEERIRRDLGGFFWWNPPMSGIGGHIFKAFRAGKRLEIACAVMCQPAVHMAAATSAPADCDEYALAGGLAGAPVELVRCETVDLEVPATAEYIIEGEMLPGEQEAVGWHSNPMGYYDEAHFLPIMRVNCITRRRDPMWYATLEMVPPFDHMYLGLLPIEGELLQNLQQRIPQVTDVVVTPNISYVIQVGVDGGDKPFPGFGRHVIHAVWGSGGRWARSAKMVIVVGPDVDPRNWEDIEWAIMTRVQPVSDIIMDPAGPAMLLDPSPAKNAQGAASISEQFGIDALIKVPERHASYSPVSNATSAEVEAIRAKLKGLL